MTREEAIKYLEKRKEKALMLMEKSKADTPINNKVRGILTRKIEVLDMAISALAENKGAWIDYTWYDKYLQSTRWGIKCNKCNKEYPHFTNLSRDFHFCPNCGADMREPKDILHKAIDNTTFAEEVYPDIKEELHKAVDMSEPKGEKGTE